MLSAHWRGMDHGGSAHGTLHSISVSLPKLNAPYHSMNREAFLHSVALDLIGAAIGVVLGQQKDISKDLILCKIQVNKHAA